MQWNKLIKKEAAEILSSKTVKKAVEEAKELIPDVEKCDAAKEMKGAKALGDSVKGILNAGDDVSNLAVKIPSLNAKIYRARYSYLSDKAFQKIVDNIKTKEDLEYLEMLSNLKRTVSVKEYESKTNGMFNYFDETSYKIVKKQEEIQLENLDEIFLKKEKVSKEFLNTLINSESSSLPGEYLFQSEQINYFLKNLDETNKDMFEAWFDYSKNKNQDSGFGFAMMNLNGSFDFSNFKHFFEKIKTPEQKDIFKDTLKNYENFRENKHLIKYLDSKLDEPALVSKIEEKIPECREEHAFVWQLEKIVKYAKKGTKDDLIRFLDCPNPTKPSESLYSLDDIVEIAKNGLKFEDKKIFDELLSKRGKNGNKIFMPQSAALITKIFKTSPSSKAFYQELLPHVESGKCSSYELNFLMKNYSKLKNDEYFNKLYKIVQNDENADFNIIRAFFEDSMSGFGSDNLINFFDKENILKKRILENFISQSEKGVSRVYNNAAIGTVLELAGSNKNAFEVYDYLMKEKINGSYRFNYEDIASVLRTLGEGEKVKNNLAFLKKLMPYKNADKTPRFSANDMTELLCIKNAQANPSMYMSDTISHSKDFGGELYTSFSQVIDGEFFPKYTEKRLFELINLKKQDGSYLIKGEDLPYIYNISKDLKPSVIAKFAADGRFKKEEFIGLAHAYKNTNDKRFFNRIFNIKELSAENIYDITMRANESNKDIPWERIAKIGILKNSHADRFLFASNVDEINYISELYHGDSVKFHKKVANLINNHPIDDEKFEQETKRLFVSYYDNHKNDVDWLKKLLDTKVNGKPLTEKEIALLNSLGKSAIYDAHHGRTSVESSMSELNKTLNGWLDSKKEFSFETLSTKDKIAFLNYAKEGMELKELSSNLPIFNFLRKFKDSQQLKDELVKNLKKELFEPGRDLPLDKKGVAKIINGKFESELKKFDYITPSSMQKYREIISSPDFSTKLNAKDRVIAKFAALFDGLDQNDIQCALKARNILEKNKLTSDITERVFNLIRNRSWYESYKNGKINEADIAVIFREPNDFEIAKQLKGKAFDKNVNNEFTEKVEKILNNIYSSAPIVKPTHLPYYQSMIPRMFYKGKNYKVIDLRDENVNLEKMGFPKGTTKENLRFLTHFYNAEKRTNFSSSSPDILKVLCDEVNESSFSTALLDVFNQSTDVMGRTNGMIFEPMTTNYAAAYNDDFVTPLKKGFTEFKQYLTGQLSPEERNYLPDFYKQKLDLSDNEYAQLFKKMCSIKDITHLKRDIAITSDDGLEKIITADDLKNAVLSAHKSLTPESRGWNELVAQNLKPKASIHKMSEYFNGANILDDVPSDTLKYLDEYDVPIVIF